jgi:hypothetical protein
MKYWGVETDTARFLYQAFLRSDGLKATRSVISNRAKEWYMRTQVIKETPRRITFASMTGETVSGGALLNNDSSVMPRVAIVSYHWASKVPYKFLSELL